MRLRPSSVSVHSPSGNSGCLAASGSGSYVHCRKKEKRWHSRHNPVLRRPCTTGMPNSLKKHLVAMFAFKPLRKSKEFQSPSRATRLALSFSSARVYEVRSILFLEGGGWIEKLWSSSGLVRHLDLDEFRRNTGKCWRCWTVWSDMRHAGSYALWPPMPCVARVFQKLRSRTRQTRFEAHPSPKPPSPEASASRPPAPKWPNLKPDFLKSILP